MRDLRARDAWRALGLELEAAASAERDAAVARAARALVAAQQLPWAGESVKVRFVDGRYEYVGADAQPAALARDGARRAPSPRPPVVLVATTAVALLVGVALGMRIRR